MNLKLSYRKTEINDLSKIVDLFIEDDLEETCEIK
jgi:hypothetical protein